MALRLNWAGLVVLAWALILLVACGGDDDSDGTYEPELTEGAAEETDGADGSPGLLDPCALVGETELMVLLGSEPEDAAASGDGLSSFTCAWTGSYGDGLDSRASVGVVIGTEGPGDFDAFKGRAVEEVDDVGDEAYAELGPLPTGDAIDYTFNTLMAKSDDYYVTVAVGGPLRGEEARDALAAAARAAIENLPEPE